MWTWPPAASRTVATPAASETSAVVVWRDIRDSLWTACRAPSASSSNVASNAISTTRPSRPIRSSVTERVENPPPARTAWVSWTRPTGSPPIATAYQRGGATGATGGAAGAAATGTTATGAAAGGGRCAQPSSNADTVTSASHAGRTEGSFLRTTRTSWRSKRSQMQR
ncbi:MAG TPA: hypothetical protein VH165_02180 [Kofleriaceae bacterium]|nr:hypothetical protein [Kofleriaceae bacterium]